MNMTEQDMLNKIKESADSVEIPESLKPNQIEQKLRTEQKITTFRWQAKHFVSVAAVLVVMLAFLPLGLSNGTNADGQNAGSGQEIVEAEKRQQNTATPEKTVKKNAGELYLVAKSYDEVYEVLKKNQNIMISFEKGAIEDLADGVAAEELRENTVSGGGAIKTESAMNDSMAHKTGYSTTNLQMAGVDESDIVKTNGSHIFMVKNNAVQIIRLENGEMALEGTISPEIESFSDSVLEMYVDGERLILILQQVKEDLSYKTVLYTYDISDPAQAKQIGRVEQDGYYKTSRKIADRIYLFTEENLAAGVTAESGEEIARKLPKVNGAEIAYDDIYLSEQGCRGLLVTSVSMDNPNQIVDNTLILNNYVEIYVSSSALYLYHSDYATDMPCTQIAKFNLEEGMISAAAAASVPGTVQDTFAINEYNENLRILTSHWNHRLEENTNQLYILDASLKPAGKIENIAEGETIYAARYFGDFAYFITYRNIDPLFAADLSDIRNPQILGELKITGYSEYLHMWGEDQLLGIGYETNEKDGSREGIKLVMFDISNPAELSVLDTVVLKNADYSSALFNYKSVLADSYTNMIGFLTADYSEDELDYYVYSFIDGKFKKQLVSHKEEIRQQECYRGLWVGDYFYIVNQQGIESFDYRKEYEKVGSFDF